MIVGNAQPLHAALAQEGWQLGAVSTPDDIAPTFWRALTGGADRQRVRAGVPRHAFARPRSCAARRPTVTAAPRSRRSGSCRSRRRTGARCGRSPPPRDTGAKWTWPALYPQHRIASVDAERDALADALVINGYVDEGRFQFCGARPPLRPRGELHDRRQGRPDPPVRLLSEVGPGPPRPLLPDRTYVRYGRVMAAGVVPTSSPRDLALPRRDDEARARLQAVAARTHPFVAAGERRLPVAGRLGELLPSGGVQRGSTIAVDGSPGSGSTTVALTLAAAATSAGEWAAVVDPARPPWSGTLGARAAADAGGASSNGWRSSGACRPTGGARWSRPCSTGSRWSSPRSRPTSGSATRAGWSRVRASAARCWSRSARGRSRQRCACTPVRASWRGLDAGAGSARRARAQRRRSRRKVAGSRGRDDAHVLRLVPRLAGGRGAPARSVVAVGARVRARAGGCARARARRVGRSPGGRRDARHAPPGSRSPVSRRGVRRRRRRARGAHVRDRRPRGRSAHAARRARPSGAVRVHDPRSVALLRRRRRARRARARRASRPRSGGDRARHAHRDRRRRVRGPARGPAGGSDAPFVVDPGGSAAFCAPWPVSVLDDPELASLLVRLGLPHAWATSPRSRPTRCWPASVPTAAASTTSRAGSTPGRRCSSRRPPISSSRWSSIRPSRASTRPRSRRRGSPSRLLFRLAERGLACTRVVIEAETEHGERLARCWRHDRVLTPAALAERVRWQLDGWLAGEPRSTRTTISTITTGGLTLLAARPRRGRARRRPPARVLGWRPGRARPRRPRARARAGHARLRSGRDRGRAGRPHARRAGAVGAVG